VLLLLAALNGSQQSLALEVFVDLPAVHVALRILQLLIHFRVEAASVAVLQSIHSQIRSTWVKHGQTQQIQLFMGVLRYPPAPHPHQGRKTPVLWSCSQTQSNPKLGQLWSNMVTSNSNSYSWWLLHPPALFTILYLSI
jgi:hypothetical protein